MPEFLVSADLWLIKIIKFIQGKGPFCLFDVESRVNFFFVWKMLVIRFNTFTGTKSMATPQTVI